jgi:hypothetical protein
MTHLTPSEFIDLLDGQLPCERARHVESCDMCGAQMESLRSALLESAAAEVPEPSPIFWDRFSDRVREGIGDRPPRNAPWLEWLHLDPRSVFAATAGVAIVLTIGWRVLPLSDNDGPSRSMPAVHGIDGGLSREDPAAENGWDEVRAAAETVAWEDAQEAGIDARPDAAEAAIMRLSDSERRQLMTLIEEELKRSGA